MIRRLGSRSVHTHEDLAFVGWAAHALLDQLRSGASPGLPASAFVWEPMLSAIRTAAGPDDRELVLRLLRDEELRMFGGLLSRAVLEDDEITRALVDSFTSEADPERQLGLFHQVVARANDAATVDALADWAEVNASMLIAEQRLFFDADAEARLRQRLADPAFERKRWVYMYAAHALDDPEQIRALLESFLADPDPQIARAAQSSLRYL